MQNVVPVAATHLQRSFSFLVLPGVLKTLRMVYKSTLMYVRGDKATPQRHSTVSIYCLVWHRFCSYVLSRNLEDG